MPDGWLLAAVAAGGGFAAGYAAAYLALRGRLRWLVEELARARESLEGCRKSLRMCMNALEGGGGGAGQGGVRG